MVRLPRKTSSWAVPVLLALAVVLVAGLAFNLANLDTGNESIPSAPAAAETSPRTGVLEPDPVTTAIAAAAFLGFLLVGSLFVLSRRRIHSKETGKRFTWWAVLGQTLGMVLLVVAIIAWPRNNQGSKAQPGTATNTTSAAGTFTTLWPASAAWPVEFFLIAFVFAAIVWVSVALLRAWRFPPKRMQDEPISGPRGAAATVIGDAIQLLEAGADVRSAILACFQRFCSLLGSRGVTEQEALTPREIQGLAIERFRVPREESGTLTSLFEEARYSEHSFDEGDRLRALRSLRQVQAALEA